MYIYICVFVRVCASLSLWATCTQSWKGVGKDTRRKSSLMNP